MDTAVDMDDELDNVEEVVEEEHAEEEVEPVSRKRTCKVGPGRFIPQYR